MPSFLKFLLRRTLAAIITLFIITVILYGVIALAPLEMRLSLYLPKNINARIASDEVLWQQIKNQVIEKYHLSDPFPIQYITWLKTFLTQKWSYSVPLKGEVLAISCDWIIGQAGNPFTYWWVWLPVTLAIILFGVGWNLLGDEINFWMNPKKDYDYQK